MVCRIHLGTIAVSTEHAHSYHVGIHIYIAICIILCFVNGVKYEFCARIPCEKKIVKGSPNILVCLLRTHTNAHARAHTLHARQTGSTIIILCTVVVYIVIVSRGDFRQVYEK